jgi:hypothetical protein
MVRRMVGPHGVTATSLAEETGIPQPTLSRWLRGAASIPVVSRPKFPPPSSASPSPAAKRPQDWSALERAQVVVEAGELTEAELGEFLRRRGLHREQLEEWRTALEEALTKPRSGNRPTSEGKRIKELERELARKEKALAEAAALLILKKKMEQYWADADDDTDPKSGK